MPKFYVARSETPPRVPARALHHQLLWEGGIIEISVPLNAQQGGFTTPEGSELFLQFARNVRGGFVNCFLYCERPKEHRGSKIVASVKVMRKDMDDGSSFLYVNLYPVALDTPITHRLIVVPGKLGNWLAQGVPVFETPKPLQGGIVLAAPKIETQDAVETKSTVADTVPMTVPASVPANAKSTGDSQLDRLLGDGWQILSENAQMVMLFKMHGGKRRDMIHHRPKKK